LPYRIGHKGISAQAEEIRLKRKIVVCDEKRRRETDDGIEIIPPSDFFMELWSGGIMQAQDARCGYLRCGTV
jgi:hypothetical protein